MVHCQKTLIWKSEGLIQRNYILKDNHSHFYPIRCINATKNMFHPDIGQGTCVVSEIKKVLIYWSKALQDDSITRGGGRANFPKHLQAFKGTPAVSWNALRPDCVDSPFLFTFKTQALFSLSCVYSWSFLKNILRLIGLRLTADLHMGKEHIRSNYKRCK